MAAKLRVTHTCDLCGKESFEIDHDIDLNLDGTFHIQDIKCLPDGWSYITSSMLTGKVVSQRCQFSPYRVGCRSCVNST